MGQMIFTLFLLLTYSTAIAQNKPASVESEKRTKLMAELVLSHCKERICDLNEMENDQPYRRSPIPSYESTASNYCDDINTANATDLQRVKGIGPAKAQAIINYRNQFGPFQSLDELARVKGIGPATVENFRRANFCVPKSSRTNDRPNRQTPVPSNDSITNNNCHDINTANTVVLQRVKGIGPAKAQAIIDYRNQFGLFQSVDELTRVKGIGPATVEHFRRADFCVQESTSTSNHSDRQTPVPSNDSTTNNSCYNINTANASDLQRVKGIGPAKAQAIIDLRNSIGTFNSLNALLDVRGIGPATLRNFHEAGFCVDAQEASTPLEKFRSPNSSLPYDRSLYGYWWDEDGDCQNTRNEILIAKSRIEVTLDEIGCEVVAGEWLDPYTNSIIVDPRWIDIDHFIPLAEVHRSGGIAWDDADRVLYTNDLSENGALIPVLSSVNRLKGDRDPAHWLPPNQDYHCQYIERWVTLKKTWNLTMDPDEHQAVEEIQAKCMSDTKMP